MKGFLLGMAAGYVLAKMMERGLPANAMSGLGQLPTAMTPVPCDPAAGCVCFDCRCPAGRRPAPGTSFVPGSPGATAYVPMKGW